MALECEYCGETLDREEEESPCRDDDGDVMCDECHHEHCQFTCCWCEDYGENKDQHMMLAVFRPKEAFDGDIAEHDWKPGVYLICDYPYYWSSMLAGGLRENCLEWSGELPPGLARRAENWWYPCGHFCAECQKKYLEQNRVALTP